MKIPVSRLTAVFTIVAVLSFFSLITACSLTAPAIKPEAYTLTKVFPFDATTSVTFDESIIANSLLYLSQEKPFVIVPVSNGVIALLEGETGKLAWKFSMPTPAGQESQIVSTPLLMGDRLFVVYQCLDKGVRSSHKLAVIDLSQKKLDDEFPVLEFSAEKPASDGVSTVKFNPPTAFSHAALLHADKSDSKWGLLYAAFGNANDTQPFHGWMFEIDIDTWLKQGAKRAISNILLTTPEAKCPITMEYGTQEMICGGGIWTPSGPKLYPTAEGFEIFVPTGNGQIDLTRHDYANTLMRVKPGLKFDDGCDEQLCKDFNPKQPDGACLASCKNLFIPRQLAGDPPLRPANRECDQKTFAECLAWMDYDLGASSPVKVNLKSGHAVLVQPGKEGAVYLLDANHLGTQYDRLTIVDVCGTPSDACKAGWMGMIVTQPVSTTINEEPVVVIPTFMPDNSHPAGLVALKVALVDGKPKLQRFWQFPDPASSKAVQKFRSHPSLPIITTLGNNGDAIVWAVDIGNPGILYGIRVKDGTVMFEQPLSGTGRQLSAPIISNNMIYLASTFANNGKAFIEAYRIELQE